jgi:Zn-dependent peptidase ImmA (M78 family)
MPPEHTEGIEDSYRGKGKQKRIEQLANNFAAALLIPQRVLQPLWQAHDKKNINEWLNKTASYFRVTAKALRWRVTNLRWLLKADEATIQEDRLTANGRPSKEQRTKPKLFNQEFVQRLCTALAEGELSVRRAASLLEITIEDLADLFKSYDLPVPFDL